MGNNIFKISLMLTILCNILSTNIIYAQAPNTWTAKASISGGGRNGAFSFGNNVKGYIGGGFTNNNVWEYSTVTNTWSQKASYPGAQAIWCSNFSIGDKGYVGLGGYTTVASDFWEYDMNANTWTSKAAFPGGAKGRVANFVISGKGYVCTGSSTYSNTTGNSNALWEYDPAINTWTQKINFPGTARQFAVGFNIGNKGYVGTGANYDVGGTYYSDFYCYDPLANTWSAIASYPMSLYGSSSFSLGNKGYVGIGITGPPISKTKLIYAYDPIVNTWTSKATFPGLARNSGVGFNIGLRAYIGTGYGSSSSYETDFYQYTSDLLITGPAPAQVCAGDTFTLTYDCASPYFTAGNVFTAQLSDASGSFTSPVIVGANTSLLPGTISVTIPAGTTSGSGYRIRVSGSIPSVAGEDNGVDITVNPIPTVNVVTSQLLCDGAFTTAITFSGAVAGTTYNWTNNTASVGLAANGSGNIASFTAANTGTANVTGTITVTPTANGCTGAAITPTITVKPTPTVNTVSNQSLCNGAQTTAITFGSPVSGTTYAWTNSATSIGLAASGLGDIASFTATNTAGANVTGTITVTPTANGCPGTAITPIITVKPSPTVNAVSNQSLCNGAATTAINFGSTVTGTTYAWTNNTTSIGLAATGTGNIASFTAINTTAANITGTITVTPTAAGCPGTAITPTITVKPTPTVNTVSNQSICNGAPTTAIIFASPVIGTAYAWTNNATSIGLAASGTGDIASFTGTNTTTANVTGTITVTPTAAGCPGTAITPTITVKPTPNINSVSNQLLCNNTATTVVNFSSTTSGTTYAWTNNTTSIGLAASGIGNIPSFTATNTTAANVTGTINVTPTANSCPGTAGSFTITVKPSPDVATVSNQTLCNGASTTAVSFTGGVTGTTYAWTNNTTSIGLASSGAGNIAAFTAINTGTTPVTATISVTPTANGCPGTAKTFTITVNPTPTIAAISNQIVCDNTATTAVNFSGTVTGTTFAWTNNTASIGLAASGSGNIASFTATNTTASPVTTTITVTPTANTCPGSSKPFTITVNPTPTVNTIADKFYCNNVLTSAIPFSSATAGTAYTWANNSTAIGLAANGTGDVPAFLPTNPGTTPISATVTVTPTANNCPGTPRTFNITVNPTEVPTISVISSAPNNEICVHTKVTFTATVTHEGTNPTYQWKKNNVVVGTNSTTYIDYDLSDGDIVTCDLISSVTCPSLAVVTSNFVVTHVNMYAYHEIEIFSNQPGDTICVGGTANFTSVIKNGGTAPIYEWKKNGVTVGSNAPTYTDLRINNGDRVTCSLSTNIMCPAASTITNSNRVVMTSLPVVWASAEITGGFDGEKYVLRSQVTNCGFNPSYQWMLNNGIIPGATRDSIHIFNMNESDKLKLEVIPDRQCTTNPVATSNTILGSQVTLVEVVQLMDKLTLSPNPNNGNFNLQGELGATLNMRDADLVITNVVGQVVHRITVDIVNGKLDTQVQLKSQLASGTYHLAILAKGQRYNARFVVIAE